MCTLTFAQVPNANVAPTVGTYDLALIWMYNHIVNRVRMLIVPLDCPRPGVPHFHGHVLGAGHHPLAVAMECYSCYIVRVALKAYGRVGVGGLDIVQTHDMATSSGKELLVWGDAKAVDLRFGMLNYA